MCGDYFERHFTEHRARSRAADAWDCHQNRCASVNVRDGFVDGFVAVSMGSRGCTPAVPPSRYWGWQYSGAEGQAAGAEWLVGYPIGAAAAQAEGQANDVASLNIPSQQAYSNSSAMYSESVEDFSGPDSFTPGPDTIDNTIDFEPRDLPPLDVTPPEDTDSELIVDPKDAAERAKDATESGAQVSPVAPSAFKPSIKTVSHPRGENKPQENPLVGNNTLKTPAEKPTAAKPAVATKQSSNSLPEMKLEKNDEVYGFGIE